MLTAFSKVRIVHLVLDFKFRLWPDSTCTCAEWKTLPYAGPILRVEVVPASSDEIGSESIFSKAVSKPSFLVNSSFSISLLNCYFSLVKGCQT